MTFRIVLIYFLIVLISSFVLKKGEANSLQTSNLGFGNYSGANTTPAQITSFINLINSASIYYRDNTEQRLTYISSQMNSTYGLKGYGFSVIQGSNETYYGWCIVSYTFVYGTVAAGVDRVWPQNSYMFLQEPLYGGKRVYFRNVGQKGSGINSNLQNVIKNTVLSVETTTTCYCNGTKSISDSLRNYDSGAWNVFCSEVYGLYASAYPYNGRYIYMKPKNCYYAIYDS